MKRIAIMFLLFATIVGCNQTNKSKNDLNDRKEKIMEMENSELTEDQIERKKKSIAYCQNHNIPTIEHLPCVESEEEVKIRTKYEIVKRALALSYLGLKSEGLEQHHLDDYAAKYNIAPNFSEVEKQYVNAQNPTEQQAVNANWRYESLHVLLWSLGYVDTLKYADEMCVVADDIKLIFEKSLDEFNSAAKLRSKSEILDQADLIYRLNWACVNSRVKGEAAPGNLNPSIVYERHYALNWLINYMDADWDNVSTDT